MTDQTPEEAIKALQTITQLSQARIVQVTTKGGIKIEGIVTQIKASVKDGQNQAPLAGGQVDLMQDNGQAVGVEIAQIDHVLDVTAGRIVDYTAKGFIVQ